MHVMIEVLERSLLIIANQINPRLSSQDKSRQHIYQSISGYISSHNLVTALLDKTVSIWHRERSAEFISFFFFL